MIVSVVWPHEEDWWRRIRIGRDEFAIVKPCDHRCGVPNVNPETGEWEVEPLRTLATYRKYSGSVAFGQDLVPVGRGLVSMDQSVKVPSGGRNGPRSGILPQLEMVQPPFGALPPR